jgi:hypothetical protein
MSSINLHGCSNVTAKAIARIPEQCPNLTNLLLSGCLAVNNFALYCLFTKEGSTGTHGFSSAASHASAAWNVGTHLRKTNSRESPAQRADE